MAIADACLIESIDDGVAIRMCQKNQSIPPQLFENSFCQPEIPDREFSVRMLESCPSGAYGVCEGARTPGVAYQQAIYYYSEPDDTPVLRAYCEEISQGAWRALER